MIRHHRLLELYLAKTLGLHVDDVHAEADRLEHVLSEELEARIDSALGYPTHDPHGDPIPDAELSSSGRPLRERDALSRPDEAVSVASRPMLRRRQRAASCTSAGSSRSAGPASPAVGP